MNIRDYYFYSINFRQMFWLSIYASKYIFSQTIIVKPNTGWARVIRTGLIRSST